MTIKGTYVNPSDFLAQPGATFFPGAGLGVFDIGEVLSPAFTAWSFDSKNQSWLGHLNEELEQGIETVDLLPPGQAIFIRTEAPETLPTPDPNLRIRYYHQDHLGSSCHVCNAQGVSIEETAFHPFGGRRTNWSMSTSTESYSFSQKETDRESGLHYFETRSMADWIGSFLSVDSLHTGPAQHTKKQLRNPQTMNPYSYVLNRPTMMLDPNGMWGIPGYVKTVAKHPVSQVANWGLAVKGLADAAQDNAKLNNLNRLAEAEKAFHGEKALLELMNRSLPWVERTMETPHLVEVEKAYEAAQDAYQSVAANAAKMSKFNKALTVFGFVTSGVNLAIAVDERVDGTTKHYGDFAQAIGDLGMTAVGVAGPVGAGSSAVCSIVSPALPYVDKHTAHFQRAAHLARNAEESVAQATGSSGMGVAAGIGVAALVSAVPLPENPKLPANKF